MDFCRTLNVKLTLTLNTFRDFVLNERSVHAILSTSGSLPNKFHRTGAKAPWWKDLSGSPLGSQRAALTETNQPPIQGRKFHSPKGKLKIG